MTLFLFKICSVPRATSPLQRMMAIRIGTSYPVIADDVAYTSLVNELTRTESPGYFATIHDPQAYINRLQGIMRGQLQHNDAQSLEAASVFGILLKKIADQPSDKIKRWRHVDFLSGYQFTVMHELAILTFPDSLKSYWKIKSLPHACIDNDLTAVTAENFQRIDDCGWGICFGLLGISATERPESARGLFAHLRTLSGGELDASLIRTDLFNENVVMKLFRLGDVDTLETVRETVSPETRKALINTRNGSEISPLEFILGSIDCLPNDLAWNFLKEIKEWPVDLFTSSSKFGLTLLLESYTSSSLKNPRLLPLLLRLIGEHVARSNFPTDPKDIPRVFNPTLTAYMAWGFTKAPVFDHLTDPKPCQGSIAGYQAFQTIFQKTLTAMRMGSFDPTQTLNLLSVHMLVPSSSQLTTLILGHLEHIHECVKSERSPFPKTLVTDCINYLNWWVGKHLGSNFEMNARLGASLRLLSRKFDCSVVSIDSLITDATSPAGVTFIAEESRKSEEARASATRLLASPTHKSNGGPKGRKRAATAVVPSAITSPSSEDGAMSSPKTGFQKRQRGDGAMASDLPGADVLNLPPSALGPSSRGVAAPPLYVPGVSSMLDTAINFQSHALASSIAIVSASGFRPSSITRGTLGYLSQKIAGLLAIPSDDDAATMLASLASFQ